MAVRIGVGREAATGERRVAMTPDSAMQLAKLGHSSCIQAGAGAKAGFSDAAYAAAGVEVLYDDRDERGGAKFATADLIGLPWQLVVGPKGVAAGTVELKRRAGDREEMTIDAAVERLA